MNEPFETLSAEKYPFRDRMQLSERFEIRYWHNEDHSEKIYQVVQRSYEGFDKTKDVFFVRAQFKYTDELIKYLSGFNFDDIGI